MLAGHEAYVLFNYCWEIFWWMGEQGSACFTWGCFWIRYLDLIVHSWWTKYVITREVWIALADYLFLRRFLPPSHCLYNNMIFCCHVCYPFGSFMLNSHFTLFFFVFSIVKKLEPMNTLASSVWWVFGFYWIVVGGQVLLEDSPRLYWWVRTLIWNLFCFSFFVWGGRGSQDFL